MSISYVSLIFGMPGVPQIILIAIVILLLFGGRKIPELMRGLGRGIKEFRNASNDDSEKKIDDKKS